MNDYYGNMFKIHFINVYLCLYVDGVWIDVVDFEFWKKMENFGFLVKNDLNEEFEVNWCFYFMFVISFIAFKSM